jgi:16S rRNA (guanine527-N7)-methyltransferase
MDEVSHFSLLQKYFPEITENQKKKFKELYPLYHFWNAKINVISRKDIDQLYLHHVLHSLAIAKFIQFKKNTQVVDIGTGGGFPGIPLAILFPEVQFCLVDSINKKITVVNEIANSLKLNNVKGYWGRVEDLKLSAHFFVTRAVAPFKDLLIWCKNDVIKNSFNDLPNGIIALKGGDLTEELKDFKTITIKNISDFFSEDFFETKKIVYMSVI